VPGPVEPHNDSDFESSIEQPRSPEGYNRATTLISSFGYAFEGIAYSFRTQRNIKIHTGMTAIVITAGLLFGLTLSEWEALAVVIGLVFQTELTNTAVEAIVDKVSPGYHELAKVAKDCSAAAVLVTAIAATVVGLAIFGHHVIDLIVSTGLLPR
jgi:diacylglycerol kinase